MFTDNVVYEKMFQKKNADLDRRSYLYDIVELVNNLKYLKAPKCFSEAIGSYELTYIHEINDFNEKTDLSGFDFNTLHLLNKNIKPSAVSVSTSSLNSYKIIKQIRDLTECPILIRDFIISPLQIFEAKEAGASAFTLTPSIISYRSLNEFIALANGLKLECILEISDTDDIMQLIDTGVRYLLITPNISSETSTLATLLSNIPSHITKIVHIPNYDPDMKNFYSDIGINSLII